MIIHGAMASAPPSPLQPTQEVPGIDALLAMERSSRQVGSGLLLNDLIGRWRLEQVWSKGSQRPARFSSSLLRGLAAQLEITPGQPVDGAWGDWNLGNAVSLGPLELRFEGYGRLVGRRPLLMFWFDRVRLRLAGRVLIERPLSQPEPKRMPFFALIASCHGDPRESEPIPGWLAARGRSGGLALWRQLGSA